MNASATNATPVSADRNLQQLEDTAGQIVGSVFFGTLLQSMRQSRLQGPYGHGGRGEEIFAGQLDGILAERLGVAMNGGIKEALIRHLTPAQTRSDALSAKHKE